MVDNLSKWVWLSLCCGVACDIPSRLLHEFGSIDEVFRAGEEEYDSVCEISRQMLIRLCNKDLSEAEQTVEWCEKYNVGILTLGDIQYPNRLRTIKCPPVLLYYIGEIPDFDRKLCIASVGTRRISEYGRINSYRICYDCAKAGAVIVSGLADGIDSVCHRAALDAMGKTVAILGCGIDVVYPKFNRDLMKEIARKGLLLTEYRPGTAPVGKNFPLRNRIISGLCQATAVFEADRSSGSLITANYAEKEGRKIYALPGQVGELNSLGTNDLIRTGAKMLVNADDLLSDFDIVPTKKSAGQNKKSVSRAADYVFEEVTPEAITELLSENPDTQKPVKKEKKKHTDSRTEKSEKESKPLPDMSTAEKDIYSLMKKATPKSFDDLLSTGHTPSEILTALTLLEIKGLITALPGGVYTKK